MSKLVKVVLGCVEYLKSVQFQTDLPSKIIFTEAPGDVQEFIRSHFGSFDLPPIQEKRLMSNFSVGAEKHMSLGGYATEDISTALKGLDLKRSVSQMDPFVTRPLTLSDNSIDAIRSQGNGNMSSMLPHRLDSMGTTTTNISPWGDLGNFDSVSTAFSSTSASVNPIFMNQGIALTHEGLRSPSTMGPGGMDLDSASLLSRSKVPSNFSASLYEYSRMRSARCASMTLLTKWGSLGCDLSRLNSPHGFCLGFDEEIVVADTYNHRIQVGSFFTLTYFLRFLLNGESSSRILVCLDVSMVCCGTHVKLQ